MGRRGSGGGGGQSQRRATRWKDATGWGRRARAGVDGREMWRGAGDGGGMCDRREPFGGLSRRVLRAVGRRGPETLALGLTPNQDGSERAI